ncbi:response regulator transcription factor [Hymenobacter sp. BRD128]|uniref:LytR/AlgR family response regulator transcription factor n=1 Tax=Hymenobacter sp. BRD128 TaxID=2675878 RepID=UPI001567A67A|nr:LytTR family DNA-binding domain-containing protein [Hymenobacter sp. BRD128]QKG57625.1 response regulator transcription factor [Hymenobacter sp. BRD128]
MSISTTTEPSVTITTPLRCLVVDDDPMSVQIVRTCIGNTPFLEASAACSSAIEAAELLRTQAFDVLFLDVEMPLMSGLDLLRTLPDPPQVVLITSSQSYAVQAFEFAVADYLLKPLSYPRFLQAAQKVLETINAQRAAPAEADLLPTGGAEFTFVKVDNRLVRVDFADVFFVEALGDYVHLVTSRSKLIVYSTMRAIEEKFPPQRFVRVHRSFIINIGYVQALEDNSLLLKDKYIPIGQTYMRGLLQRLNKL